MPLEESATCTFQVVGCSSSGKTHLTQRPLLSTRFESLASIVQLVYSRFMLTIYRRHTVPCPYAGDRFYRRCNCPMWISGTLHGRLIRESLKTRSWAKAEEIKRRMEDSLDPASAAAITAPITVKTGVDAYIQDGVDRGLTDSTLDNRRILLQRLRDRDNKHRCALPSLLEFCEDSKLVRLVDLTLPVLREWRSQWAAEASTRSERQKVLSQFLIFCVRSGWLKDNVAPMLGSIKVDREPTGTFTPEDIAKVIDCTYIWTMRSPRAEERYAPLMRALIDLMLHTGLRISDAVALTTDRIDADGNLYLHRTKKSLVPVYVPLPPIMLTQLQEIEPLGWGKHYFWDTSRAKLKKAVNRWQYRLNQVFLIADLRHSDGSLKRSHPHMFRDTFAVRLLSQGVPLDVVSTLLGHASVRVTEEHYAPWVKARQDMAAAAVRATWTQDRPTQSL
jgi:integrase/recombinase XerD